MADAIRPPRDDGRSALARSTRCATRWPSCAFGTVTVVVQDGVVVQVERTEKVRLARPH
jgi:hypothetical protein